MAKKPSLGKDVDKSIDIMDKLSDCLQDFTAMSLKKGLQSNKISDEKLVKVINEASEKAVSLKNSIEDIKDLVKVAKPKQDSRFANKVVKRFLEDSLL
jgi:hypothetical protein